MVRMILGGKPQDEDEESVVKKNAVIQNVLFVPKLANNLFSVRKVVKLGN